MTIPVEGGHISRRLVEKIAKDAAEAAVEDFKKSLRLSFHVKGYLDITIRLEAGDEVLYVEDVPNELINPLSSDYY